LPPYIKACVKSDPNINDCVIKHANEAIPHLVKGDRKYKIQVLDPFDVEELKILNDGPRPTGISITLKNAKVYGLKNIVMKKAIMNLDEKHNHFEVLTSKVQIIGQYEASGRILVLPISGNGNVTLTVENMYILFDEYWNLVPRDGEIYLIRHNVTVTSRTPTGFRIHITNLFNGNKLLGDQTNAFLNENWKDAYKELSPTIFNVLSEIITSVISRISDVVPYDIMFPEKLPS
jgi:hypothetical protein